MRRADNPQYQLTRAEYPAGAPFNGEIHQWSYDAIGNRTSSTVGSTTTPYTYQQNTASQNGQLLANDGVYAYSYRADGSMQTRTSTAAGIFGYDYDSENRLVAITGSATATYTFDYQGRRTIKTVGGVGTTYLYDGLDVVRETTNIVLTTDYLFGPSIDEPLALYRNGQTQYVLVDGLGSDIGEVDASGAVAHASIFDVWGVTKTETGTRFSAFGYTGREFGEGGLWFYRARYYQPGTGRFIRPDPISIGSRLSPYAYVRSSPTQRADPSGMVDILLIDPKKYPGSRKQNRGDQLLVERFNMIESADDEITVGAHGTWWGDLVAFHQPLSPKDLAQRIRAHARWRPGMKVRLIACLTGRNPKYVDPQYKRFVSRQVAFAQDLANELQAIILAPDGLLSPQMDGTVKPDIFVNPEVTFWPDLP